MKPGKVYGRDEIQSVWRQFHYHPKTVVWSDDNGDTWNEPPSMDTGKWPLKTLKDGNFVDWIFKTKE